MDRTRAMIAGNLKDHGAGEHGIENTERDGLPVPRRYFAAITIWLTIAMAVLDAAIANVALPTIAAELRAAPAVAIWVINGYQLAATMLLLPCAAMGDRIGHARVYLGGLVLFIVGSLLCAVAGSLDALIAARVVQGVGAAGIMSMSSALVRATYPSSMLGQAMGYNALVIALASALGPSLASAVLAVANWPWLFAINVPVGLISVAVGWRCLPHAPGHGRAPDYVAALLSAAMLGLIVYGAESFAREGRTSGLVLLMAGLACAGVLIAWERGKTAPLFPTDLLAVPILSLSLLTSMTSFAAQTLAYVTLPFMLQATLGRSVVETGLLMTPWPIAAGTCAFIAGRLADRWPAGLLGCGGLVLLAGGLFSLSRVGLHASDADLAWRMALCGAGFGTFQIPNNRTIVGAAPQQRSGAAGGMLATARLLGQTAGAVVAAAGFHRLGLGSAPVLLAGGAVAALVAAGLSLSRLRVTAGHRLA